MLSIDIERFEKKIQHEHCKPIKHLAIWSNFIETLHFSWFQQKRKVDKNDLAKVAKLVKCITIPYYLLLLEQKTTALQGYARAIG